MFFRNTELVKTIRLMGQKTVTDIWCTIKCLPEILQKVNVRGLMFPMKMHLFIQQELQMNFLSKKLLSDRISTRIFLILLCATFSFFF